VEVDTK